MVLRTDPSIATGYAPGELLLGRKLVYPIEIEKSEEQNFQKYHNSVRST